MKTRLKHLFLLPALVASLGLIPARQIAAQTFTTLYSFTNGNDGANPYGIPYGVVLAGHTLYGTTTYGGDPGDGTVFAVNTDGAGFTTLYSFSATDPSAGTNEDGAEPNGLILSGNTLYGTATVGGTAGNGTVFSLNLDGTGFTTLYNFSATDPNTGVNTDGAQPFADVILSGDTLFGTTTYGGESGNGTVFAVNTDGTGFAVLHTFSATDANTGFNTDGAVPYAELTVSGGTLFGTGTYGGAAGNGTVFALNTNGTRFTTLYNFSALDPSESTNSDGAYPNGVILSGATLYGTANAGGNFGNGTVFAVNTNGADFTSLHNFSETNDITGVNGDGADPLVGLILSRDTLFGTSAGGGGSGNGTIFAVNTNGTDFTTLYSFTAPDPNTGINSDGANPEAGLILSGDTLYSTAYGGGGSGYGTVFSLSFAPILTIIPSGTNVVLTWPTNVAGFTLQSTTNLASATVWNAVSPPPVVVNSRNTVTNRSSVTARFYRLIL